LSINGCTNIIAHMLKEVKSNLGLECLTTMVGYRNEKDYK